MVDPPVTPVTAVTAVTPVIRIARLDDDGQLRSLEAAAWSPLGDFPSSRNRRSSTFLDAAHPPEHHLVADLDGRVVGYVRVRPPTELPENSHVLGIFGLAVLPDLRGHGIASALLTAAEAHARGNGAEKLMLRVLGHNAVARRLYERHGYVVEGTLCKEFRIEGAYVDDVLMAKWLG